MMLNAATEWFGAQVVSLIEDDKSELGGRSGVSINI